MSQSRVEMNQLSPQKEEVLAINDRSSVAVCVKGNLSVSNALNLEKNKVYQLSDEFSDEKNAQFLPSYQGVRNWYENYFIADGSRIKFEVIKDSDVPKEKPSKRKKGQELMPQTNIKKIIYLTKVLNSGF